MEPVVGKVDYPQNILFQIKILMFFAAEYTINRILPNTVLKSTAINALYSNIKSGDRAFYDEFSDGAEYSFYYLAIRKESSSVIAQIAKAFSMLCGKENETFRQCNHVRSPGSSVPYKKSPYRGQPICAKWSRI